MAQVSLQINGYGYVLGCADGEEDHLFALASDLDRRIEEIKASSGPSGEARMLLMAALLLSDELHELRDGRGGPFAQDGRGVSAAHAEAAAKPDPKISKRLRGLAKRAEAIADSTEPLPFAEPPSRANTGINLSNGSRPGPAGDPDTSGGEAPTARTPNEETEAVAASADHP